MENIKPVIELELYLVRHGQSRGNVGFGDDEVEFTEINDPRLTELGTMQAKKAGKYLSDVNFDACYASGLIRTVQTANEIMKFQKEKKDLNILPIITEVGVNPEFPGRTVEDMKEVCPTAKIAEGFENAERIVVYSTHAEEEALYERATEAIAYFRSRYNKGEKVLVAGHAAFNTIMMFHIMGFTKSPVFDIEITNTGITHVIFYKEGTNRFGDIVFDSINDTKHFCIPDEDVENITLSKKIAENPEKLDESVKLLTLLLKKTHSEKCEELQDIKPEMVEKTDDIMHYITAEKWQKLRSLVTAVENSGTVLAADFTVKDVFCDRGEAFFKKEHKDKGYPVFDLGKLYERLIALSEFDRENVYVNFGFTFETAKRFWEKFINEYFAGEEEDLIKRADDRIRLVAYLNIFHRLIKDEKRNEEAFSFCKEKLLEYVTRCGSLDFE